MYERVLLWDHSFSLFITSHLCFVYVFSFLCRVVRYKYWDMTSDKEMIIHYLKNISNRICFRCQYYVTKYQNIISKIWSEVFWIKESILLGLEHMKPSSIQVIFWCYLNIWLYEYRLGNGTCKFERRLTYSYECVFNPLYKHLFSKVGETKVLYTILHNTRYCSFFSKYLITISLKYN